jgi:hypothetical protein
MQVTVVWEPNERTSKKKFQRVVAVCKDFGLSVSLHKCVVMKISQKTGSMRKIKCNNHEIKKWRALST